MNKWKELPLTNIVMLSSQQSGQFFLDNIYPFCPDCLIFTADGYFPQDAAIHETLVEKLKKDPTINLVVIGALSLDLLELATDKVWILDSFLMEHLRKTNLFQSGITSQDLGILIHSYFSQSKYSLAGPYLYSEDFHSLRVNSQNKWIMDLLQG